MTAGRRYACYALSALAAGYLVLRLIPGPAPATHTPFGGTPPLVLAHRGGMGLWPENTLHGFRAALELGADVLEMDVRRSADGHFVLFHDATLERTTDGTGPLAASTLGQLTALDAGYHFTPDRGQTFPYRARGIRIPTLEDVFGSFPGASISLELKEPDPEGGEQLCRLIARHSAARHLLVSSFHQPPIDALREHCPQVATGATPGEASRFFLASTLGLSNLVQPRAAAFFLFERLGPFRPASRRFVAAARALGLPVYVWGADPEAVAPLLDAGVAGIATDRPDRLLWRLQRLARE